MKLKIDDLGVVGIIVDDWSFEKSFKPKTIVTDYLTWKTYISRRAVPKHIELENSYYWKPILKPYGDVKNVQSDWNQDDDTQPDYIKNKPDIENGTDKPYEPLDFSGMGKVYLKKNIVNIGGVDKNILVQDAFYKGEVGNRTPNTNTIFVVNYDFDLNGEKIQIPENCGLEFAGGSIKNGVVFSNATMLFGIPNMEKYFGAFKDANGRWLDQDLKPFDLIVKKDGYVGARDHIPYPGEVPYNGVQSLSVCEYNNNEYIFIAKINTDDFIYVDGTSVKEYRPFIDVVDINYHPVGYTVINDFYGHANGITIKDGFLLIPSLSYNTYYKISISTIIENASNDNTSTTGGDVITSDALVRNICYDPRTDYTLFAKTPDYYFSIFDENNNLVNTENLHNAEYYFPVSEDARPDKQQTCIVNGIIYQLMIGYDPRENYLAVIDAQTGELITWSIFKNRVEIEGICFYNGVFYIAYQNTLFYKLGTHGNDFVATEDYLRNNLNSMAVYLDNKYTGVQKGSERCPFSSLSMALAITNGLPSVPIYIAKSSIDYNVDEGLMRFSVDGTFMCYHERLSLISWNRNREGDTESVVSGPFMFRGFVFRADNISFDGKDKSNDLINLNEPPRAIINIVFNNCIIKNYNYGVYGDFNYDVKAIGCTFTNLKRIIHGGYGNVYIESSTLSNMSHITTGFGDVYIKGSTLSGLTYINPLTGKTITLESNRYSNISLDSSYCIPSIVCHSNKEVDDFISDYLDNAMTIGDDGVLLDIRHSNATPSVYGVTYVRGIYRCFDASYSPKGFYGHLCHTFPIRSISEFNNASLVFKKLFSGMFISIYNNNHLNLPDHTTHGVRMLIEQENNSITNVTAIEVTGDGRTYYDKVGAVRPTMYFLEDVGNNFYDTTINKMIFWSGDTSLGANGWITADGGNPDA